MNSQQPAQRVQVVFLGQPPVGRVERASGVSDVRVRGRILRCLVDGSFQPFLEALHGSEVITLQTSASRPTSPQRSEGGL